MIKNITLKNLYKLDIKDTKIETSDTPNKKRSLVVSLEVSRSGKVINGRIYPPSGQRNTLDSWTKPFAKPVLTHHNDSSDPIGRFTGAEYQDLEREALGFLRGDVKALADIKKAFASNNAKSIVDTMRKYGALDVKWPGLGRVIGHVKILDQDAIEKVLDGRYSTVSAGQSTDALTCGSCGAEWHKGDMCDHRMGTTDENGDTVVFVCGNMRGKETSFVNMPANDTSITLSMELSDDENKDISITVEDMIASETTPIVRLEKDMELKDLATLEIPTVLEWLSDEDNLKLFLDGINGDTNYEQSWLIRVHDALHSQWDYSLKYGSMEGEGNIDRMPKAVYGLHGAIHDTAMDKGFRDSLVNGELDNYDNEGHESVEYQYAQEDSAIEKRLADIEQHLQKLIDAKQGVTNGGKEEGQEVKDEGQVLETPVIEPVTDADDQPVDDETIDWEILDLALMTEVGDAKLSSEKREKLATGSFCGPGRSFPVPDCAHATAARRLIGRAKLSDAQKSKVLACVSRKAKAMGCDGKDSETCNCSKTCTECASKDQKISMFKEDYAQALLKQEQLKDKLLTTLRKLSESHRPDVDVNDANIETLLDWADKMSDNQVSSDPVLDLKPVESPSITSVDHTQSARELTNFQKQTVKTYYQKLKKDGKVLADRWLSDQSRFLPSDFKISTDSKE